MNKDRNTSTLTQLNAKLFIRLWVLPKIKFRSYNRKGSLTSMRLDRVLRGHHVVWLMEVKLCLSSCMAFHSSRHISMATWTTTSPSTSDGLWWMGGIYNTNITTTKNIIIHLLHFASSQYQSMLLPPKIVVLWYVRVLYPPSHLSLLCVCVWLTDSPPPSPLAVGCPQETVTMLNHPSYH